MEKTRSKTNSFICYPIVTRFMVIKVTNDYLAKLSGKEYCIVGPVEVTLHEDYKPGEKGQPTIKQFDSALRTELSDFLIGPNNHPIIFKKTDK